MSIGVPSRFAVLSLEEDDSGMNKRSDKKKVDNKQPTIKRNSKGKKPSSIKHQTEKKDKKFKELSQQQWADWQQKDTDAVNENFEQDLKDALIQSKLDFEVNKTANDSQKNNKVDKKGDKKKKNKPMSLDKFLHNGEKNESGGEPRASKKNEQHFFENMCIEVKKEITKDKVNTSRKNREANIDEVITLAQYEEKFKKEHQKYLEIQEENKKLKKEIADIRFRNKSLCKIMEQGEMKDKADILMDVERLNIVKTELTEEVARLHALLEQERSKVASLESQKHKEKIFRNK